MHPVGNQFHVKHDEHCIHKNNYGPVYVLYNEEGQHILLPQMTDMSHKDNLKLLYNSQPEGMYDTECEILSHDDLDTETFNYSHESSTKQIMVQGVFVGTTFPLIADIKTQPYSMITYSDEGIVTGIYDNTHEVPILIDNGSMLNIMLANSFL